MRKLFRIRIGRTEISLSAQRAGTNWRTLTGDQSMRDMSCWTFTLDVVRVHK